MVQLEKIPVDLIRADWLQDVVAESKRLSSELRSYFVEESAKTQQRQAESTPRLDFAVGQLVLVRKPFYEKATGLILPQCSGPYEILKLPDQHNAVLVDPLTGFSFQGGKYVGTSRLAVFNFPTHWLQEDQEELFEAQAHQELEPKDFVAIDVVISGRSSVHVARVMRFFEVGDQIEVQLHAVPAGSRFGPWERRPWKPLIDSKYQDGSNLQGRVSEQRSHDWLA